MNTTTLTRCTATLDRKAFAGVLKLLDRVTERRNTIPVLSCIRLSCDDGKVTAAATDLDIAVSVEIPAEATRGEFLIELAPLKAAVSKMKGEFVVLADGDEGISLSCPTSGATLRMRHGGGDDPFPVMTTAGLAHPFTLPASQFRDDLARTSVSISTEETRYYLNGVYCHVTPATASAPAAFRMASTDGHRLTRISRDIPADMVAAIGNKKHPMHAGMIVPRKAVRVIREMIGTKAPAIDECRFRISNTQIEVRHGRVTILSKLINGTFPDYSRVIPSHNGASFALRAAALSDAVAGVTAHCNEQTRGVTLRMNADWATLTATSPENGVSGLTLRNCETATPRGEFAVGFNARYLIELAGTFGGGYLVGRVEDAAAPALFTSPDVPELIAVLMPLRACEGLTPYAIAALNRSAPAVADVEPAAEPAQAETPVEAPAEPVEAVSPPCDDPSPVVEAVAVEVVEVVEVVEPEAVEPEPIEAIDVPDTLATADAAAAEALQQLGAEPEPRGTPDNTAWWQAFEMIWRGYVGTANGTGPDGWQAAAGRQRDRKARNRGKVVIAGHTLNGLRDRLHAMLPGASAPIAAPVVDQDQPDLAATVAKLVQRIDALERGLAPKVRTSAHLRAIRTYLRMRADRARMREAISSISGIAKQRREQRDAFVAERDAALASFASVTADRDALARAADKAESDAGALRRDVEQLEQALAASEAAAETLRAEIARLAPIANAIAALTPPAARLALVA